MGYYLFDHPNPHGDHFYPEARVRKLAAVMHITAGSQDIDGGRDPSAENTAHYAATTDREVSWHSGSDTDTFLYLLPPRAVAWHVVNYNGPTYGHEISKAVTDWRIMPEWWVEATLRQAAACLRPVLRELGIPIRKATRAELDHAIATGGAPVGLISHAELQPSDRTDPGWVRGVDTFPWARFLQLLNEGNDDDMTPEQIKLLFAWLEDMLRRVQSMHVYGWRAFDPDKNPPPSWRVGGDLTFMDQRFAGSTAPVLARLAELSDDEAKVLAAIRAMPTGGQVDVDALADELRAGLSDELALALGRRLIGTDGVQTG